VTDIEFGLKHTAGNLTDVWAIRFKVNKKKPESELEKRDIFPKRIGPFMTDVLTASATRETPGKTDPKMMIPPLMGGVQIQSGKYTEPDYWGTLGCFFPVKGKLMGLTNYHVLYGDNTSGFVEANYAGRLAIFQPLTMTGNRIGTASNLYDEKLDYALFELQIPTNASQHINLLPGQLGPSVYPRINMKVCKSGARTGLTFGVIDARSCLNRSELSIHIDAVAPGGILSDYGDSGAIWVLNDGADSPRPVALHWGRGETRQWANARSFAAILTSIHIKANHLQL